MEPQNLRTLEVFPNQPPKLGVGVCEACVLAPDEDVTSQRQLEASRDREAVHSASLPNAQGDTLYLYYIYHIMLCYSHITA